MRIKLFIAHKTVEIKQYKKRLLTPASGQTEAVIHLQQVGFSTLTSFKTRLEGFIKIEEFDMICPVD